MSAHEIRAEERCLSAAEVVAVWGTGTGPSCKALHFGIVICGHGLGELTLVMMEIKWHSGKSSWILQRFHLSHPEHLQREGPCCTLLWKITAPVCSQRLFETISFPCRLCIISHLGPVSKWLTEVYWTIIHWNQHQNPSFSPRVLISLSSPSLRIPLRLFPCSLCATWTLPEGLVLSDLVFWAAAAPGSLDKARVKSLASCCIKQSQHRLNYQRSLGAKLIRVFIVHI